MRNLFRQSSRRQPRRLLNSLSAEVQSLEPRTLPAGIVAFTMNSTVGIASVLLRAHEAVAHAAVVPPFVVDL